MINCHKFRKLSHYLKNLFIFSICSLNVSNKNIIKKSNWKKFFYNFRKSRRSIFISRWNGVITFRDRRVDIFDVGNEDGWISMGLGDAWTTSIRLGLLLNNLNLSLFLAIQMSIYWDVQALLGSGFITDTYCFMNIWCASSLE